MVFINPEVFNPDYVPETLLYRNPELGEISSCIRPAIEGRRPSNAKVCGKPATGKTTAIKLLLEQLWEEPRVALAYVNCKFQGDRQAIMCRVHEEVVGHSPGQATSFTRVCEAVFTKLVKDKRFLVVVLDDVNYVREVSDVLYTLLRAHETFPGSRVSVIAIASSPRFRVPLEARVASSFVAREVYFRPYTHEELAAILGNRARLGFRPGAVARDALEAVARLADERDLRFGIELLRESGEVAEDEGSAAIEKAHVEAAKRRLSITEDEALPRGCMAIYDVLEVEVGKQSGDVYPMVKEEVGSYSTFTRRVNELEKRGMVRAEMVQGKGRTRLLYRVA